MTVSVRVVCADRQRGASVAEMLQEQDTESMSGACASTGEIAVSTTRTVPVAADCDCLVGIPAGDPVGLASELAESAVPAVLYAAEDADASAVFDAGVDDLVRRDGTGSSAGLLASIERLTASAGSQQVSAAGRSPPPVRRLPLPDGGTEQPQVEFPLKRLHEIAADRELSRMEKIDRLLTAGAEQLETSNAFLSRIEDDTQEIIASVGSHPELRPGEQAPLSEAYCQYTLEKGESLVVDDAEQSDSIGEEAYERFGLACYLGTPIIVDGGQYGTVCFVDSDPRQSQFGQREQHFAELLTDWIGYLLEQRRYEHEIEQQRAFTESLMDSLPDPLYALDDSRELVRWNNRFEELVDESMLAGEDPAAFILEEDREEFVAAIDAAMDGDQTAVEADVTTSETVTPYEFSNGPLHDELGAVTGVAGVGRDITERQATQERLSGILDTTRSLMQARDRNHVAEIAVNAARELLGFDISVFRLYDSDENTLVPAAETAETADIMGERPVYDVGNGYPGEVFASGEPRVINDLTATDGGTDLGPARSVMYYPVGVHGTISVCSTEPDAFDGTDEQMLALLATSAAAACMRAKREQDVREAQEHTERVLDRVNGLIQNTVEVLVSASTREELENGVVEELASAKPYSFAWIGQPDVASKTLSPTAWAGDAGVAIHGRSFSLSGGEEPVGLAYREQGPQVVPDLAAEPYGPWGEIAAGSDVNSLIAIPLVYKDAKYGVLSVLAADGDALDERERIVLESLGRVIANAINAIERGRILDATEIIELEFSVSDQDLLYSRLSATADCELESVGTDYQSDGTVRLYLTARGVDAEELVALAEDDIAVTDVTCIVEHEDECLIELTVEESLLATLTEYGAVPREVIAENGVTRVTVELPYEAEARDLFELVEDQYPSTELLGYHERERAVETRQEFKASLAERFTDRQETALRTAYLGGFFDWPRDIDGNELATAMDISRPTYHQHLRAAQQKVFEELFE